MNKVVFCFVFSFILITGYGQTTSINITFQPSISNELIELNTIYSLTDSSKIEITTCRFYVSNFSFFSKGKLVTQNKEAFLIDLENPESLSIDNLNGAFDQLIFNLGIDSSTNVAGILDGDLDPIKGMYWTWNSGYINFKLEGSITNNTGKKNPFEYHLGGYLPPFRTIQTISIDRENVNSATIQFDISQFISSIDFEKCSNVMIPGATAVQLSKSLATCFKF